MTEIECFYGIWHNKKYIYVEKYAPDWDEKEKEEKCCDAMTINRFTGNTMTKIRLNEGE